MGTELLTAWLWLQVGQGADVAVASGAPASVASAAQNMADLAAQAADAGATGITEYLVYGGIAAVLLFILFKALRAKPAPVPVPELPPAAAPKTAAEVRAAARADAQAAASKPGPAAGKPGPAAGKPGPAAGKSGPAAGKPGPAAGKPGPAKAPLPASLAPVPAEAAGKTLREGLSRTHDGFVKRLGAVFGGAKTIDDDLLANLEEILFTADIGVRTSQRLLESVHAELSKKALKSPDKVYAHLRETITEILVAESPPLDLSRATPLVIMVVGVNGAGKTTTIGKLARRFQDEGKKVLLAAADTFRAAAVEQLQVWGERAGVEVVRGAEAQDPSSVVFEAIERARKEGFDVCIADTAGRLQAKKELMDELAKVHRVAGKAMAGAPHEVWLVLDATNGQNAISQARLFTEAVAVTGIVLTKLDGTAKGGVVIGISDEMKIPVRFIGIGEKVQDLRPFEPRAFADALFGEG